MYKYMHVTDENQDAYIFFSNRRVQFISKGAEVIELLRYILNFIVLCMLLNLPNYNLIFKDYCFLYI